MGKHSPRLFGRVDDSHPFAVVYLRCKDQAASKYRLLIYKIFLVMT